MERKWIINKFEGLEIRFTEHPTSENYSTITIKAYKNGRFYATFDKNYLSFDMAKMLTSNDYSKVYNGILQYVRTQLFWASKIEELVK